MATKSPKSSDHQKLLNQLNEKFGEDLIFSYKEVTACPRLSTGIIALDELLGGGVGLGKITEFYGKSSSGKSTICFSIMAQGQRTKPEKLVVYIDNEGALDLTWATKVGINLNNFVHIKPTTMEQGFTALEDLIDSESTSVIVVDSIPAGIPAKILEGDIGEANIGLQARIIAQECPRIANKLGRLSDPPAVLFINQKRANLQSRQGFAGYEPTKSTGGMSLPHYMTTRIDVARIGTIKDALEDEIGQEVLVHVIKNRLHAPGGKARFHIINTRGIDTEQELLDMALESGEIVKSGSWYVLDDGTKLQGAEKVKEWIKDHKNRKAD
jgi:recombination protein RecA